jgi:hypothetical protein
MHTFRPKIIVDHDTTAEYESNTCITNDIAKKRMENLVQWAVVGSVVAYAEVDEENVAQLGVVVVTSLRLPELRPLVCISVSSLIDRGIAMDEVVQIVIAAVVPHKHLHNIVATSDHPSDVAAVLMGIPSLPHMRCHWN